MFLAESALDVSRRTECKDRDANKEHLLTHRPCHTRLGPGCPIWQISAWYNLVDLRGWKCSGCPEAKIGEECKTQNRNLWIARGTHNKMLLYGFQGVSQPYIDSFPDTPSIPGSWFSIPTHLWRTDKILMYVPCPVVSAWSHILHKQWGNSSWCLLWNHRRRFLSQHLPRSLWSLPH